MQDHIRLCATSQQTIRKSARDMSPDEIEATIQEIGEILIGLSKKYDVGIFIAAVVLWLASCQKAASELGQGKSFMFLVNAATSVALGDLALKNAFRKALVCCCWSLSCFYSAANFK